MVAFLGLFLHILVSPFKTQARLEAEKRLQWRRLKAGRCNAQGA
jgi:hypothetical protein